MVDVRNQTERTAVAPEWLLARIQLEWEERYSHKIDTHRIRRNQDKLQSLVKTIGRDGYDLLREVYNEQELVELRTLPAVETLRRIWLQQYYIEVEDAQWREKKSHGFPPARKMIAPPDDQDARYGSKSGSTWTGYKIHLTETCERYAPRLVTYIETTVATSRDTTVTEKAQDDLIARGLEPEVHLADGGYMDADNLVSSQDKEIDRVGPVRPDSRWQSKVEGGYDASRFKIDWGQKVALCLEGQSSSYWKRSKSAHGQPNAEFRLNISSMGIHQASAPISKPAHPNLRHRAIVQGYLEG